MAEIIRYRAGFIGCGNMGGTLAANAADSLGGDKIGVCDTDRDRVDRLVGEYGCDDADIPTLIEKSDYVFLGLKPGALRKVMPEYADCFAGREDCVVVSMAAGVTIEEIRSICGGHGKIISIMPNLGCRVEEGMILESTGLRLYFHRGAGGRRCRVRPSPQDGSETRRTDGARSREKRSDLRKPRLAQGRRMQPGRYHDRRRARA